MNKTTLGKCPPLTTSDILTIRGKPLAKWIKPTRSRGWSPHQRDEEWIYYSLLPNPSNGNPGIKEHYLFKNGYLVGWKQNRI